MFNVYPFSLVRVTVSPFLSLTVTLFTSGFAIVFAVKASSEVVSYFLKYTLTGFVSAPRSSFIRLCVTPKFKLPSASVLT